MSADRIKDIVSNLDFAHESNRELSTLISEAQKIDGAVKHISQKAAAILAATRECFDYCIADIKSDFLARETRNVYYPFHPDTMGNGKPLYGLLQAALPVYYKLLSVASAMQTGELIKGTLCPYSDARAVNELVNSKKHDRVIEVCESGRSKSRIEFPNGAIITASPMFPVKANGLPDFSKRGPVGPEAWLKTPGVRVIAVKDFFFDSNGIEMSRIDVHGFCMTAITATRFILGEVYSVAYGQPLNLFHEKSHSEPAAQASPQHSIELLTLKEVPGTGWASKVGPSVCQIFGFRHRPMIVGLRLNAVEQLKIEFTFEGEIRTEDRLTKSYAQFFIEMWRGHMAHVADQKISEHVFANWDQIALAQSTLRWCELTEAFRTPRTLCVGTALPISFDTIVWGIGTKYTAETFAPTKWVTDDKAAVIASALNNQGKPIHITLVTDQAGQLVDAKAQFE